MSRSKQPEIYDQHTHKKTKLSAYIKSNFENGETFLVKPLIDASCEQRGETCKLYGLSHLMDYELAQNKLSGKFDRFPLYKNKKSASSLRQLAKESTGSVVGEMYTVESLQKVSELSGFKFDAKKNDSPEKLINSIIECLKNNKPCMVFFDVDLEKNIGYPTVNTDVKKKHDHCAIVVGFYHDKTSNVHFIVNHWDAYWDFDGEALAKSTFSLEEKNKKEVFVKIKKENELSQWVRIDLLKHYQVQGWNGIVDSKGKTTCRISSNPEAGSRTLNGVVCSLNPHSLFKVTQEKASPQICQLVDSPVCAS